MTMTSCIRHPEKSKFITLHQWQVEFCHGSHCAALVLSFMASWHDWKLKHDTYYQRANDIAEMHGDPRSGNQNAYLFFTTEDLMEGCINLYGKKAIVEAVDYLVTLGVISVHKNPNPRYHFDKTKYFQFYPQVCNEWIAENYPTGSSTVKKSAGSPVKSDVAKTPNALSENGQPTGENTLAITNNTNNTNNKLIKADHCLLKKHEEQKLDLSDDVHVLVDALLDAGMPEERLTDVDDLRALGDITRAGVTTELIIEAYSDAVRATSKRGSAFGVRYLAKVVESKLAQKKIGKLQSNTKRLVPGEIEAEPVYICDLDNARGFAADLL